MVICVIGSTSFIIVSPVNFELRITVPLLPRLIRKMVLLTGPTLVSLTKQLEPPMIEIETEPLKLLWMMLKVELSPLIKLKVVLLMPLPGLPVTILKVLF